MAFGVMSIKQIKDIGDSLLELEVSVNCEFVFSVVRCVVATNVCSEEG